MTNIVFNEDLEGALMCLPDTVDTNNYQLELINRQLKLMNLLKMIELGLVNEHLFTLANNEYDIEEIKDAINGELKLKTNTRETLRL